MSGPIRILQVVTKMDRAGMESRLMDLYRVIDKSKIQFDFYTCRQEIGVYDDEIKGLGGIVYYNPPISMNRIFSVSKEFESFLTLHPQYRIIHCHLNQWTGLILLGAKKANVPIRIAHSRTALEVNNIKNIIKNIIKLPVNYTATHKFAVSKKAGMWLFGKQAIKRGEVLVWPNSIDVKKFRFNNDTRLQIRKSLHLENDLVIIHVGNLRFEKNHTFLIEVFKEVKGIDTNSKLVLVGADNMNGKIQHIAEEYGISNEVIFLGSRSDVNDLLQAGDIFIFPSLYEGFPGAVLEAQAAGLPCLISENITEEVMVTPRVKKLSLRLKPKDWAKEVFQSINKDRLQDLSIINEKGYDIHNNAMKLSEFYLEALSKYDERT